MANFTAAIIVPLRTRVPERVAAAIQRVTTANPFGERARARKLATSRPFSPQRPRGALQEFS